MREALLVVGCDRTGIAQFLDPAHTVKYIFGSQCFELGFGEGDFFGYIACRVPESHPAEFRLGSAEAAERGAINSFVGITFCIDQHHMDVSASSSKLYRADQAPAIPAY